METLIMTELENYDDAVLIASDSNTMTELEKIVGQKIPCMENRDEQKKQFEEINKKNIENRKAVMAQVQSQSGLQMQYQQVLAYELQLDQQSMLSLEELENRFVNQFIVTMTPEYKTQIQAQLQYMVPSYGENHPSVKQLREILEMDENKAKIKAKSQAEFWFEFYKLRAISKKQTDEMNKEMYNPTVSLENLKNVMQNYYNIVINPEYQGQLAKTLAIGNKVLDPADPTLIKINPLLGMDEKSSEITVNQTAQQIYKSIQVKTGQISEDQNPQIMENYISELEKKKVRLDRFGFACINNRVIALNLANINLENLPESIGNLTKLQFLDLSDNKLDCLPETIGNLENLEEFYIKGSWSNNRPFYNSIKELPKSFHKLKKLQKFSIDGNELKNIPDDFQHLLNLKEISIKNNGLEQIPDIFANFSQLIKLDLSENRITKIVPSIGNLTNLIDLSLRYNSIEIIPEYISNLNSLEDLSLDGNKIKEIPLSLFNLNSLHYLNLSNNCIKKIPEDIVKLNLSSLYLSKNQLNTLPYHIWQIDSLKKISLDGNPLSTEELSVTENDAQTIKDYCRQRASIAIMLISTDADSSNHRIPEIIEFLEKQSEVFGVIPGEESNLNSTDLIIFLATNGTVHSPECIELLKKGKIMGISIIPLKGLDIEWGNLATIDLSRELGIEFAPNDFENFCNSVYDYIKLLKRKHNIFKDKSGLIRKKAESLPVNGTFEAFQALLIKIINSEKMAEFFKMYQSYVKPQFQAILQNKASGLKDLVQMVGMYYQVYDQQTKGGAF